MVNDMERTIEEFQRAAKSVLELFQAGVLLSGRQETILIDAIHDLQMGYNEWLTRQPLKEQSFPPDGTS